MIQNDETRKFHLPYNGLYRVVEVLPPLSYVIESLDGSTTKRVYFNRLKKSCGIIKENFTAEDKFKKSSVTIDQIATWDFVDVSPQVNHTCHRVSHNINSCRPNLRPRSTMRRPPYYPDV